jgi:hypothetical protein
MRQAQVLNCSVEAEAARKANPSSFEFAGEVVHRAAAVSGDFDAQPHRFLQRCHFPGIHG